MLAGKLAARARAFVAGIGFRDRDPVGRRPGPLAFSPDQPIAIVFERRPYRRLQQLLRRGQRCLVRSQALDLFQR